jgi:hypothetical protein
VLWSARVVDIMSVCWTDRLDFFVDRGNESSTLIDAGQLDGLGSERKIVVWLCSRYGLTVHYNNALDFSHIVSSAGHRV